MEKFIVTGGNKLKGTVTVSGAKNAALKALIAACLTDEEVIIKNIPLISDFFTMIEIIKYLGGEAQILDHSVRIRVKKIKTHRLSLETAARIRTSFMFIVPLLLRTGNAIIPNPGGCRLGARPVERCLDGLRKMGADITYNRKDGFFYAKARRLKGVTNSFKKNTHTGTETMLLAAVLAEGKTILHNAAEEPEVDELIELLISMGADIKRTGKRVIEINGVKKLHGTTYSIGPDRNEIVTFAIAALITRGDVFVKGAKKKHINEFIEKLVLSGGGVEEKNDGLRFYYHRELKTVDVRTSPHPGFMTDWQAPWGVLMTQAIGECTIHETVFENKLGYVKELQKMGANTLLFNPEINNPDEVYNFNLSDDDPEFFHAVKVKGPTKLHDAIITMQDIRAGAAVLLAALAAKGTSTIYDIEKLDRGYEVFEKRLKKLGAKIKRVSAEKTL
jgi:UDP-N-acetylglucosamine 1-carboxyvinyltransferase